METNENFVSILGNFRFQAVSRFPQAETKIGFSFPVSFPLVSRFRAYGRKPETKPTCRGMAERFGSTESSRNREKRDRRRGAGEIEWIRTFS